MSSRSMGLGASPSRGSGVFPRTSPQVLHAIDNLSNIAVSQASTSIGSLGNILSVPNTAVATNNLVQGVIHPITGFSPMELLFPFSTIVTSSIAITSVPIYSSSSSSYTPVPTPFFCFLFCSTFYVCFYFLFSSSYSTS